MEPKFFTSPAEFRTWLERNHDSTDELWVGYYKKGARKTGISYSESVEEAICFGWIDGLIHGMDDETYKRRFTPRKRGGTWSKINRKRVQKMIDAGKMTAPGFESVRAAKESGEWEKAYRVGEDHDVPPELENALKQNMKAWKNFQNFSNTNQHAYITQVNSAKTRETKERRIKNIVELAEKNLPPYDKNGKRRT